VLYIIKEKPMDTADTGNDTGSSVDEEFEIQSAAELAGEEGGFSCTTKAGSPSLILFLIATGILFIYRRT
jgi:hypothetical protein